MGTLYYPDENKNGCRNFSENDFKSKVLFNESAFMNPMVMVDRGGCSFLTKVRNVEEYGAKLAIVVDNREEHTEDLVMADDGSGGIISIPSFLISMKDGKKIKETLKE